MQPKPPTIKGPADWFTGDVWIDPIVAPTGDSPRNMAHDHFMTHISITRGPATWGDHVTDAEYGHPTD